MGIKKIIADNLYDFAYAIAYRKISGRDFSSFPGGEGNFRLLKPSLRYWYADPLLATINQKDILFMEVFDRKKHKGLIGVSTFDSDGNLSLPEIILEEEFHLSFPLVFSYRNEWILMPECADSGQFRFYKLDPETFKPTLIRSIPAEYRVVDTVVLSKNDEGLVLLGSPENPENPKQTSLAKYRIGDLRNDPMIKLPLPDGYTQYSYLLRNGGPVLDDGKSKIRILQESTESEYGHNLIFRRIVNEGENYKEEDICKIYPEDIPASLPALYRLQGTHTYSLGQSFEVLDLSFTRPHAGNLSYNNK